MQPMYVVLPIILNRAEDTFGQLTAERVKNTEWVGQQYLCVWCENIIWICSIFLTMWVKFKVNCQCSFISERQSNVRWPITSVRLLFRNCFSLYFVCLQVNILFDESSQLSLIYNFLYVTLAHSTMLTWNNVWVSVLGLVLWVVPDRVLQSFHFRNDAHHLKTTIKRKLTPFQKKEEKKSCVLDSKLGLGIQKSRSEMFIQFVRNIAISLSIPYGAPVQHLLD